MAVASVTSAEKSKLTSASASASDTSSVHSGDTSDRRDVDVVTQSSLKSEEYRLLFRLPPDEVLVEDFNCALQDNILLQGHMYLFIHHICFYSNIFGYETKKIIPFHEVTHVRKAKTAAIFHNAIEIVTGEKKHFFGSFLSRDEAYRLIIDGWAQHNSGADILFLESMSDNSQDNSLVIVEPVGVSTQLEDASSSANRSTDANNSEECKPLLNCINDIEVREIIPEHEDDGKDEEVDHHSSVDTWNIEDIDAPKIPEHFSFVIEAKFPVCVEEFFTLFISDRASDFLESFHRSCGDKEFQCTPWREQEQFGYARNLSFLHPVKVYIGAKLGRCQEVQKYRVYRNSYLMIETAQHISDVPYADYFHVERIWTVEKNGNEETSCILRVYCNVAFSKRTMFKGKIEQSTRDELREVHGNWVNNARELLKQNAVDNHNGISGQNAELNQDREGTRSSSKPKMLANNLHTTITPIVGPRIVPEDSTDSIIDKSIQEKPYSLTFALSIFREPWANLLSFTKSQNYFPLYMVVATVAILILMQISIIVLITRVPQVHVVTQSSNSHSDYRGENLEWLEKRVVYLKEEMLLVETRMERMRHEYLILKEHLQNHERFKPKL